LFKKHGVKATFYLISTYIEHRLSDWKEAMAFGHEIGNHSVTHPCTGNYPDFRYNALERYTLEMMAKELDEANAQIKELLGLQPRTFAYPCGLKFVGQGRSVESYVPLVAERFIAGRSFLDCTANDPTICDLAQTLGTDLDNQDFDQLKRVLDVASDEGRWLVFAGHEIGPRGYQTTDVEALGAILDYMEDPTRGIWLGTVEEIARYVRRERDGK